MARNRSSRGAGPSQRQLRVGELIRRTLSEVLARGDVHDPELNRLSITVAEVRATPDLKTATAYVVPLGGDAREATMEALERNRAELRRIVARTLTLKFAPELRFAYDETFDRMDHMRELLNEDRVRRDVATDEGEDDDDPGAQG
ncbi:30S ribosome-binding factor RbfA [Rhodobacteraceae bacterium WD3A24]|nr:30S ribosome-binding factor RbfA [Rhodobacteraceae bacterium WD3A24]